MTKNKIKYKKVLFKDLKVGEKFYVFPYEQLIPGVERIKVHQTNNLFVDDPEPKGYPFPLPCRDDDIVFIFQDKKETNE